MNYYLFHGIHSFVFDHGRSVPTRMLSLRSFQTPSIPSVPETTCHGGKRGATRVPLEKSGERGCDETRDASCGSCGRDTVGGVGSDKYRILR